MKIESMSFGCIVINGKKYRRDVIILPSGEVKKRKGKIPIFGSHRIKKNEFDEIKRENPDVIIVGTGTVGKAKLESDAREALRGIEVIEAPSREAVKKFNELSGKKVGALIHITC
jgi:hypothetical protein